MIFTGTFKTYDNINTYSVTIGDTGSTTTISDPTEDIYGTAQSDLIVMFDPEPVIINTDRQDLTKRIIISQATINLLSNQNMTDMLFASTNRSIPVTITRDKNICFFGYVDPLQFDQGYAHNWESVQITATDPLGALEQLNVGDLKKQGIDPNTTITSWDLMLAIFTAAGISTVNDTINSTVKSAMKGTNIKPSIFFGESEDDWMTLYDTLTEICKYFNLYVAYYNNAVNISCTINETSVPHNISSFKNAAADSSTSISVDDTYSQVTVTAEIEPVDDIIVSYDDNDYLYSDYHNMDKYMTEYISEGEGKRAYNGFYDLITTGKTDYDQGYYIDHFCYVMRNDMWDFGEKNYTTQGYTDQRDVLNYLKVNSGKGAIIGFGKGNKLNDKDNSPVASVSLTNYLVISVNGTFDNSDAGGTTMEKMITDATPVCSYKGLSSSILSPSDPTITNYIVISGKILLNPLQPLTGPNWKTETEKLTNTIQSCIDVKESTWPLAPIWHNTVPMSDNGDGAYYQQKWYNDEKIGIYGFIDNSKNQRFEYKYDRPGDSTDRISKLPILACELKVGDKYCVERLDMGETGVGKFQWMTELECANAGVQPVFTIGIDPKIDDKVVGQSFSIQNNVNYKAGLDKTGTAIPIKASDKLAGDISFKILGPYNLAWEEISSYTHGWAFYKKTHWRSTLYHVLQYIQSIMVSNLKIEMASDNGLINKNASNADNDLVYASDEKTAYTDKLEEDIKICTPLTLDECQRHGVKYQISNSYIYKTDNTPFYGFTVGSDVTKPEECLVDYYYKEYCTPAKMITTSLKSASLPNGINGTGLNYEMMKAYITGVYPSDSSPYRIMSYETSLKEKTIQLTLREYKTQGDKQI